MEEKFVCPKCGTEWVKNEHYKTIIQIQNQILLITNQKPIIDMCGKCNHYEYE